MDATQIGQTISATIIALGGGIWGIIQTAKTKQAEAKTQSAQEALAATASQAESSKHDLAKSTEAVASAWQKQAGDFKELLDAKEAELKAYRDETHKKLGQANVDALKLTEEVGELRAKTDLVPVMSQLKHITDAQEKTSKILLAICKHLKIIPSSESELD